MGWVCTPQIIGLVRGEPKPGAKHRANAKAIILEMGKERISKSVTLDRSRSNLNQYTGFESGFDCVDAITQDADNYRIVCKGKGGTERERKLRADAVIACSVIFNPPYEICKDWDDSQYLKFYRDSADCLGQICPSIFRDDNVRMSAEHYDEGMLLDPANVSRHIHKVYNCIDTDGKYCGNLIDAKLMDDVNHQYPAFMRLRGWDMDDLDCTDWAKMQDEEYKQSRKKKRKQSGRDVSEYVADKLREQLQENVDLGNQLTGILQQAEAIEKDNLQKADALRNRELEYLRNAGNLINYESNLKAWEKSLSESESVLNTRKNELDNRKKSLSEREINLDARESALDDRERVLRDKEDEIAIRDENSLKTANAVQDAASEAIKYYRDAQQFYLQEQTWSGAEARRHIQERNREANKRIKQSEQLQTSVRNYMNQDEEQYIP